MIIFAQERRTKKDQYQRMPRSVLLEKFSNQSPLSLEELSLRLLASFAHPKVYLLVSLQLPNSFFFQLNSLKKRKLLLRPLVWHLGKGSRGLFIYLVTEFFMLNKSCCLLIAILCAMYSLSNALDPFLHLHLWVWYPARVYSGYSLILKASKAILLCPIMSAQGDIYLQELTLQF